jgi:hypothetical protein
LPGLTIEQDWKHSIEASKAPGTEQDARSNVS